MDHTTRIYCKNTQSYHDVPVGTPISDIYIKLQIKLPHLCVGAKVNNRVEGLRYRVYIPRDIEFIDISSMSGMRVYLRSLCFVLYKAVDEVIPNSRLRIEHPISKGYYCQINNHQKITQEQLEQIKQRMKEIIAADIPFHREEAMPLMPYNYSKRRTSATKRTFLKHQDCFIQTTTSLKII
jgi:Threonyl-tRNA synthetase